MRKTLSPEFFRRDTLQVARELLGKNLVGSQSPRGEFYFLITEVEAYDGPEDKASHASRGRTPRTEVMFEKGGCFYVYLIYGMYYMLNIVTGGKDYPAAVLIRGTREISGPGRLTRDTGIDKSFNKLPVTPNSGLWIEDRGIEVKEEEVTTTPRIGVDYAEEEWKNKEFRFLWRPSIA